MSLIKAVEIVCDGCEESVRVDSVAVEWKELRNLGWTRGNGKHHCGWCSAKPKDKEKKEKVK
tara:strand:- start:115 stop:300 length:186 start_codon:yes stop_codon:yes gene_type:complete